MSISSKENLIEKTKDAKADTEKNQLKELVLEKWYECQRTFPNYTLDNPEMKTLFESKIDQLNNINNIGGPGLILEDEKVGNKYVVTYLENGKRKDLLKI